jgi:hypothetical protein
MPVIISVPEQAAGLEGYAVRELRRIFRENWRVELPVGADQLSVTSSRKPAQDLIVLGTSAGNPAVQQLLRDGFLSAPTQPQGYSMRCGPHPADPRRWLLAIGGADPAGTLYALRDPAGKPSWLCETDGAAAREGHAA